MERVPRGRAEPSALALRRPRTTNVAKTIENGRRLVEFGRRRYLASARPPSAGEAAAVARLRRVASTLPPDAAAADVRAAVAAAADAFREERVDLPGAVVARLGAAKIREGDVVATYGRADAVERLLAAARDRVSFEAVVVDAPPDLAGRATLKTLYDLGVPTT